MNRVKLDGLQTTREDTTHELEDKDQNAAEHTCGDLPFCSEGKFGFVKSLAKRRNIIQH